MKKVISRRQILRHRRRGSRRQLRTEPTRSGWANSDGTVARKYQEGRPADLEKSYSGGPVTEAFSAELAGKGLCRS